MKIRSRLFATGFISFFLLLTGALLFVSSCKANANSKQPQKESTKVAKAEKPDAARNHRIDDMIEKMNHLSAEFDKTFDQVFDDDFFANTPDPFKEMKQLRKRMHNQFKADGSGKDMNFPDHFFDAWFNNRFGGRLADIERKEDKNYVYYEIKVKNPQAYEFSTRVKDGQVMLSAKKKTVTEKKSKEFKDESVTEFKLERSFPLPKNVNANKFKTKIEGNLYIVEFPKTA